MTKEFVSMAREIEQRASDPQHRKGARLLRDFVVKLRQEDLLPESFRFRGVSYEYSVGESVHTIPTHSKFAFTPSTGVIALPGADRFEVLTPTQSAIFSSLLKRAGHLVTHEEISDDSKLQGYSKKELQEWLKVNMRRIRIAMNKLGLFDNDFPDGYILTVHGRGHVLVDPENKEHIQLSRGLSKRIKNPRD